MQLATGRWTRAADWAKTSSLPRQCPPIGRPPTCPIPPPPPPGARPSLALSPTASTFPSAPWMPSCAPRFSPSTTPTDSRCPRKALKVVDLKDILAKANVAVTGKANKQDLIAKILGAPEAIDVYNKIHGPAPPKPAEDASAASPSTVEKSEPVRGPTFLTSSRSLYASRRVLATATESVCSHSAHSPRL